MKPEIILREFHEKDASTIESIICEAWHYHDLCNPKTACKLSKVFLRSCLANQTYTQTAVLNGTPVGIIMAKSIQAHRCPIKHRIRQALAIIALSFSREGRTVSNIFSSIHTIDKQLFNECQKDYQAELSFFAVAAAAQGKGVGKKLFHAVLDKMKSQNINNFYLFTDTSCNYGFYEHQGMVRRCEIEKTFLINGHQETMTFFLYDYQDSSQ